jgi:hypothetical protein
MNFSDLDSADMKLFIETKRGMIQHHERLVEVLSLLNEIKSTEYCEDIIPFSCEDYFEDADYFLGKGIWIVEEAINTLLADGLAITKTHFNSVRQEYLYCEEHCEGGSDEQ